MIASFRLAKAHGGPGQRYRPFLSELVSILGDHSVGGTSAAADQQAHMFTLFDFGAPTQADHVEMLMAEKLSLDLLDYLQSDAKTPPTHYLSEDGGLPVHVFHWRMQASPDIRGDGLR